jgi:hypothetical protein
VRPRFGYLVAAAALGCSSTPAAGGGGSAASEDRSGCASTVAETNATACNIEGSACTLAFACEVSLEDVHCLCEGARWRCYDPVGLIDPGDAPRCINPGSSNSVPCPSSMGAAQGAACDRMQRACFYEGDLCADGVTKLDYCLCQRSASGGMAYACSDVPCGPSIEAPSP